AWTHYIQALSGTFTKGEMKALKTEMLGRARKVAEAAGGILGGSFKISSNERAVLLKMEKAFSSASR
ncbi:MAG: hypothetical protein HQL30_03795, partial [Candidatus Omnitrophica bacterium]|nr:hypothetical protein [Candidatus Omnitrophota bacterium]